MGRGTIRAWNTALFALGVVGGVLLAGVAEAALIANWTMDDDQADMELPGAGPHYHPDDATDNYEGRYYSFGSVGDQYYVTSVAGHIGTAAKFYKSATVGNSSHAVVWNTGILSGDTTATGGAWFLLNSDASSARKRIYADSDVWKFGVNNYKFEFSIRRPDTSWSDLTVDFTLQTGVWYYGATVFDGASGMTAYLIETDGTVHSASNSTTTMYSQSAMVLLGNGNPGTVTNYAFEGTIDDVKLFDEVLSESEILFIAAGFIPEPASGLLLLAGGLVLLRRR